MSEMLIAALPDWSERILKSGQFIFPYAVEELENRLLAELRRNLEGVEDDQAEVERAALIAALATEQQIESARGKVPLELSGGAA